MSKKDRPQEQETVNTTIVGGRPPGCGKPVGDIPRGIEILVKKAAVDPEFKEQLLANRGAVATAIGLHLDPAETMMLNAVSATQLAGIIEKTIVPAKHRSTFMGKVAAAMLAALGASILAGCSNGHDHSLGVQPDRPPGTIEPAPPASKGVRPDRPEHVEPEPNPEPSEPLTRGIRPDRPIRLEPTDGIRPE